MELKQITFEKGNLRFNVDTNLDGSYSIDVVSTTDNGETWDRVGQWRTDEVATDDLIEGLNFIKNYNFIQ